MSSTRLEEVNRVMTICNACRYCEGFCAVFPAMELRRAFTDQDLKYLANLCHNCRGCYYACQYAPPHEFNLNVPRSMAALRQETYQETSWPKAMKGLFQHNGSIVSLVAAFSVTLVLSLTLMLQGSEVLFASHIGDGAFYRVIPYGVMVVPFSLVAVLLVIGLWKGFINLWRATGETTRSLKRWPAHAQAIWDVLRLKYLDGGGHGCNYPDDRFSMIRRNFHHAVFYGFMLCLASTTIAFFYDHCLHRPAPYPFWSWPVLLGTIGGLALMAGTGGMLFLKWKMDKAPASQETVGMDVVFTTLLLLISFTGLLVLCLRATPAMGTVLAIHLGFVLALFTTMPYGKFVHGVYRYAALVKNAIEQSRE